MKARLVEETQNFERGQHPRASMGIGGIVYQDEFGDDFLDLEMKWHTKLKNELEGKTITTEMVEHWDDESGRAWSSVRSPQTVKVKEVLEPGMKFDLSSKKSSGGLEISLWVIGENGHRYDLGVLDKKIYIE